MTAISIIFKILAALVSIYSTICFIRIICTWIPALVNTRAVSLMAQICDPFLNLFTRLKFMQYKNIDFSPLLAFAVLSGFSQILMQIATTGTLSFAYVLVTIINLAWGIVNSIFVLFIILLVARLVFLLINKGDNLASLWVAIDSIIFYISHPVLKFFAVEQKVSLKAMIGIALVESFIALLVIDIFVKIFCGIIGMIPF